MAIDTRVIDAIIHGKIEPKIYAFHTGTIPDYLKVGDTYRPVATRLDEWRRPGRFPDLVPVDKTWDARVDEHTYFRDLEIHSFLENEKHYIRLQPGQFPAAYYSREFFKGAEETDIDEAVTDIEKAHAEHSRKYRFYSLEEKHSQEYHYTRNATYSMRPNQETTVNNFIAAKGKGITKMLMFAVMRFGKSFTSMQCALAMQAKFVLIVSGKADVKEEWKKTVESHVDFANFFFLTKEDLERDSDCISKKLNDSKKVVVFLTLQDLNGNEIKKRHRQIFKNKVDLLIVDETHFAARAKSYGRVLREENPSQEELDTVADAEKTIKRIHAEITLHLSGTPYEILANREFERDAIIAQYQFSDIIADRQKWDTENADAILKGDSDAEDGAKPVYEWDNPYFGFPEMIRFAFHLNKSAREKLALLEEEGKTTAFSELFGTYSNDEDATGHDCFKNEREVFDFLKVIDGTEADDEVFGFLDYDKIKKGHMCRHMVMVLPYCASCDAMEKLLDEHKDAFHNLSEYHVLNISGFNRPKDFDDLSKIKEKITAYEANDEKTLTLTVNRMLTGCTVPEWDTMIYLKGTASPQEYDQAIFRLQSQFVKTYVDGDKCIKIDMKPQTLLVDFMPFRVFHLQGKKSGIHNANTEKFGGNELEIRIKKDLEISPIITLNHNKLERVAPVDIIQAISQYSASHSVFDEVDNIPVDYQLRNDPALFEFIQRLPDYKSKGGIQIPATPEEGGTDLDTPDETEEATATDSDNPSEQTPSSDSGSPLNSAALCDKGYIAKYKTLFSNILYYAFLTSDIVNSLDQILQMIDSPGNKRIAQNLGLSKGLLRTIRKKIDPYILGEWDNHIFNINKLSNDPAVEPLQRALTVIGQLSKISAAEVKTPETICDEMVALFPDDFLRHVAESGGKLLDIASKTAEFPLAFYKRMKDLEIADEQIQQCIYAIPTSKMTYEFTLKFFRILGLKEDHISCFTSYDLLEVRDDKGLIDYKKIAAILTQNKPFDQIKLTDTPQEGAEPVKFEAVIGNPPYQEPDGGAKKSAQPIYQKFVFIAEKIEAKYLSLITPTRWFAGGKGLDDFRDHMLDNAHIKELHDYTHPEDVFPDTNNRGGICYFFQDNNYINTTAPYVHVVTHMKNDITVASNRLMRIGNLDIFVRYIQSIPILDKVGILNNAAPTLSNYISPRKPFGIESNIIKSQQFHRSTEKMIEPVKCYAKGKITGYVEKAIVSNYSEYGDLWKVYLPRANNIGTELNDDNLNAFVGEAGSICTEAYLFVGIGLKLNQYSAINLQIYLQTKFARFFHLLAKASHDATSKTYRFVPLQDFTEHSDIDWSKSIAEIDQQLYRKYNLSDDEIAFIEKMIKPME